MSVGSGASTVGLHVDACLFAVRDLGRAAGVAADGRFRSTRGRRSHGLAAGGQAGVVRVLELLEAELENAMRLVGVTALDQLDATYVRQGSLVRRPGAFSALPFADPPDEAP